MTPRRAIALIPISEFTHAHTRTHTRFQTSHIAMYQRHQMADPALIPGPYWHTKGLEFTSWQGVLPKGEEGEG
jgi:hypothetical protein